MPTLNIRDVPAQLYQVLRENAKQHHRSLNKEVIVSLEKAVHQKRDVDELLERARKVREKIKRYRLSHDDLNKMKSEGRE